MRFDFSLTFSFDTLIALMALILSVLDLVLHMLRDRTSLKLSQDPAELSCNLHFTWFNPYQIAFFHVTVENRSSEPATIRSFSLRCPDRQVFQAQPFDISDDETEGGLTLLDDADPRRLHHLRLGSENLLNHRRLEAKDSVSGYLVFFGVPPLESEKASYTIVAASVSKRFSARVTATRLPKGLRPINK